MSFMDRLLVVTLEQAVAAPIASCKLADAGARVIKLERAGGDFARGYDDAVHGHSSYFVWINRGKESCRVDLRQGEDRALVLEMLAQADVFIQNMAPGRAEKLGLGAKALMARNPRLVTCEIRGFAEGTPDADRKAYDLLIQAETGLSGVTGTPESGPSRVGISICDITTGLVAHAAILEALLEREESGRGAQLQVSLFDTMADLMNVPYLLHRYGGQEVPRAGLAHPSIAPYGAFDCADGAVIISVQNEDEWRLLCREVLQQPELVADPRFASNVARVANRAALDAIIAESFATRASAALIEDLEAHRIANGRVSSLADLTRHRSASFQTVATPDGAAEVLAAPVLWNGRRRPLRAMPALGAQDCAIRREFIVPHPEPSSQG
ncbi:MAG: CoA transferase [Neomegalonema sp.]|nr:CoA transferase [Neomegalonema sp.]